MQAPEPHPAPLPVPGLVLPLAALGCAAAWIVLGGAAFAVDASVSWTEELATSLLAALVGAVVGEVLSRRPPGGALLLTVLAVGGGVVVGALFTLGLSFPFGLRAYPYLVSAPAVRGALAGLALAPAVVQVVGAARRAARARPGSLVAGAERRAAWSVPLAALAAGTLAGAPLLHDEEALPFPGFGTGAALSALAAGLILAAFVVADALALLRLGRAAGVALEEGDSGGGRDAGHIPRLDLGVGEEVRASLDRAAGTYRRTGRPTTLLLGSPSAARASLARGIGLGAAGLVITASALAGHLWAATPAALLGRLEPRCHRVTSACAVKLDFWGACRRAQRACHDAGAILVPADVEHGEALLREGCQAGGRCNCAALDRSYQGRSSGKARSSLPEWYLHPSVDDLLEECPGSR